MLTLFGTPATLRIALAQWHRDFESLVSVLLTNQLSPITLCLRPHRFLSILHILGCKQMKSSSRKQLLESVVTPNLYQGDHSH